MAIVCQIANVIVLVRCTGQNLSYLSGNGGFGFTVYTPCRISTLNPLRVGMFTV